MTEGASPPSGRRPRYAGTHPRRFDEKYKERDAARYPEERAKVIASGKTPAGSHVAVLVAEVLAALARELDAPGAVKTVRRNFAGLRKLLDEEGLTRGADLILADLGVSSMQLDDPARGFSWKHDVPLDLRMNPARGQPAGALLLRMRKEEIEDFLRRLGDEPEAAGIAAALHETIEARRAETSIRLLRTSDVAAAVESAFAERAGREASEAKKSSLQRTFQAIRILVNDELAALDAFLRDLPFCLAPGGRAAIVTFHSGEDRRVKKAFKAGLAAGLYARVAGDVIRPTPEERGRNPRSSAAKLRWAVRAGAPHPE